MIFVDTAALQARFDREAVMLREQLSESAAMPADWKAGLAMLAGLLPIAILAAAALPS